MCPSEPRLALSTRVVELFVSVSSPSYVNFRVRSYGDAAYLGGVAIALTRKATQRDTYRRVRDQKEKPYPMGGVNDWDSVVSTR